MVYLSQAASPVPACPGDCDRDEQVTVNELITMVNIALDIVGLEQCPAGDVDDNASITVNEIVTSVTRALNGCR